MARPRSDNKCNAILLAATQVLALELADAMMSGLPRKKNVHCRLQHI
jgi:hypothetical protein